MLWPLLLVGLVGAVIVFKDFIISFIKNTVIPIIQNIIYNIARILYNAIQIIEKTVRATYNYIQNLIQNIKDRLLGIITYYETYGNNTVNVTTQVYNVNDYNQVNETTITEVKRFNDLPPEIQQRLKERGIYKTDHRNDLINELNNV